MRDLGKTARWTAPFVLGMLLAGCGVKNLPQAPNSDGPPTAVVEPQQGANPEFLGASSSQTRFTPVTRITAVDSDETVSAAEVSRRPNAPTKPFFLDTLLN